MLKMIANQIPFQADLRQSNPDHHDADELGPNQIDTFPKNASQKSKSKLGLFIGMGKLSEKGLALF